MNRFRLGVRSVSTLACLVGGVVGGAGCAESTPPPDKPEHGLIEQLSRATTAAPKSAATPIDPGFYRAYAETRGFRLGLPNHRTPTPDGSAILFLRASKRDPRQALFEVDAASGNERVVLSPDDVAKGAESLSPQEKARRERMRVVATGFTDFELSKDGARVLVSLSGKLLIVDRASGKFNELPTGEGAAIDPHLSADGSEVAFVRDNDVYILPTAAKVGSKAVAVTKGGSEDKTHGLAEFIAAEELERQRGFWWAPDGQKILFEEADLKSVDHLSLVDPGHPENPTERVAYPRPGKANADVKLGLAATHGGAKAATWIEWDRAAFPYVARVVWSKGAAPLVYVLDRAQQNGQLLAVDAATGKTHAILREHDDVFLNIDDSVPRVLPGGTHALWTSERDGAWRLYDLDLASGALKPLTDAAFGYREVIGIDEAGTTALLHASPTQSENHVFSLPLAGGAPKQIDKGSWSAASVGEQTRLVSLSEASTADWQTFPVRDLTNGQTIHLKSDAEPIPFVPTTRVETVGADKTSVAITLPHGFDPSDKTRKYPVIDAAYGGPHAITVMNRREGFVFDQVMADAAGAIVVCIDARGTPFRGRDWERAIANKFAEVPLEGHVTALRALFAAHPEMDADRVGVFGWSFGGYYAALAVLRHPDLYKVGVAGAPVADWRDYDTGYTERYLGVPPASGQSAIYDASSLLTYAAQPISDEHPVRPLMVIHGTADDNVYFVNSLRLTGALERAHRPFVFYPLVGVTHMPIDPTLSEAMWAKITTYLSTNLQK